MVALIERIKKCAPRRWRSESGVELIEFALAFPLLLLVVLGIIDFGFLFQRYEVITNAAREGARIATLPNYQTSLDTNVANRVNQYLLASDLDPAMATVDPVVVAQVTLGGNCMTTYTVWVRYPHTFSFVGGIASYFGGTLGSTTLIGKSTMRGEYAC
jgi:Flp pilus assembly protein TadG